MITVKRYANRKLYDAQAGRYVTLEEIGDMVRAGDDLRVIDYASGADLTTLTLLQVVLEEEKSARAWLPHDIFERLIRAGKERVSGIRDAVLSSLEPREMVDREIGWRIDKLLEVKALTPEEAERLRPLLLDADRFRAEIQPEVTPPVSSDEIQALIAEIERLNAAVDELSQPRESPPA